MDSPDSPGRGLIHSLNAVVSWLHSEGFYAAEETLLREIENRYPAPDAVSPRSARQPSGSPGSSGGVGAAGGDLLAAGASAARSAAAGARAGSSGARQAGQQSAAFAAYQHLPAQQSQPTAHEQQQQQPQRQQGQQEGQEDTVDFMPALQLVAAHSLTPVDSMESAEKVLEAWRSKSTTPAASPKKVAGLSPPPSPPLPWSLGKAASDLDEYENDDDPGFQRMDVVGQEAALGLELDQMSESSAAAAGDALYHQLQQYDSLGGEPGFSSHARHASIDMGLLNRQLHGGASRSSASSSQQRARSKQQQRRQGSSGAAQPLLLHEAVTSGEHWRSSSSGQLLLPPGVPGSAPVDKEERQQQDSQQPAGQQQQQQQPQQQEQQQEQQRRQGSPGGSEGGASYCSGEIVGSPGHPASGYPRSDSYAQRQAGTAQWVYDRANSVDADAYRSLLGHLERPGTGQSTPASQPPASPAGPVGVPEPEQPQASASLEQPQGQGSSLTMRQLQQSEQAGQQARGEEAEVCSPLYHQESISRVSSLGESMLQEAAALSLSDAPELLQQQPQAQQHHHQPQPGRPPRPPEQLPRPGDHQQWERQPEQQAAQDSPPQQGSPAVAPQGAGAQAAAAATAAAWAAAGRAAQQQAQQSQQVQQQQQQVQGQAPQAGQTKALPIDELEVQPAELAEPAEVTPPRLAKHLPALRLGGGHQPGSGGKLGSRMSISTAADTTAADRGSEGECSSLHGSSAHTPDGASIIDYSDPFSFPVTPPSEVAPPPDPAPLFGSWASLKSSPDRKGGLGGYGTEDESTPARRRYQQQAAAAAVAAAAAAKEQGGVQRSIKFPPLGAPGGLATAGSGMLRGYGSSSQLLSYATPSQPLTDEELGVGEFDQEYFDRKYEVINLKVIHRRNSTGFEQARELPLHIGDLIAGRYQIVDLLGQAAFSRAVQALDLRTGALVCLKIIKNNKDYFDQGLDEVKLLRYVNAADPGDESGLLRLHDFFYFKEHLVLVTELLRANLYEFQKYNRESGDEPYFTLPRIQSIARQVLTSLSFLHSLGLVHADLKPENILVKSYSRCQVKVIDLGSSCYLSDHLSSYVQSRSYRAPEVILGLSYDHKIDLWSLGCILAELATGRVLFQNDSVATLLARLEGILGPLPRWMLHRGRYAHKYFLRDGRIFEKSPHTGRYEFLRPKATSLARRVPQADEGMLSFLKCLLQPDPTKRPTAAEALQHPWIRQAYYAA